MSLLSRVLSGIAVLTSIVPDPVIDDFPLSRRPSEPLGLPRAWGKPGGRKRVLGYVGGRYVLIDEPRLGMLLSMPREKARHWLAHNRSKFSYAARPAGASRSHRGFI